MLDLARFLATETYVEYVTQEPGSNDQIKSFAKNKGASFQVRAGHCLVRLQILEANDVLQCLSETAA